MQSFWVFLFVGVLGLSAHGADAPPAAPPTWAHTAEASLLQTSGNTSVNTLGLGASTLYQSEPWKAKAAGSYLQSSNSGTQVAELLTADVRADRALVGNLSAFGQIGALRNVFAGFNSRFFGDAGLSYSLIKSDEHNLSFELGVGGNTESRLVGGTNSFAMVRGGAEYKWKFSSTADFSTQLTALENLVDTSDLRVTSVSAVSVAMTSLLSLKVSFRVDFLNRPVTGKLSTDTATTVAVVAKF
jgi:putative salt-induced outer membrane protein